MTGENIEVKQPGVKIAGLNDGEFDPGSERTLAARFKHASRTARGFGPLEWRTGE